MFLSGFFATPLGGTVIGGLIALAGVGVAQFVAAMIARNNRAATVQDKLRDAVSAILVMRQTTLALQKDFFDASDEYWQGADKQAAVPGEQASRRAYYQHCDQVAHAVIPAKLLTREADLIGALAELSDVTGKEHREDPGKHGRADDGVDANRALQARIEAAFDQLEEATRTYLLGG
jgi:hypothetical protein